MFSKLIQKTKILRTLYTLPKFNFSLPNYKIPDQDDLSYFRTFLEPHELLTDANDIEKFNID